MCVRLERGARDNDHCIFLKLSLIRLTLFPSIYPQESEAPPLTIFAVAFVALLTWSAALESSSLYGPHSTETPSRAKIFPAGAPASLGTPAAVVALESLLQYTLQMHQDYWHVWKAFIQLMAIFIFS